MNKMTFSEAFKGQLEMVTPLTESSIGMGSTPKTCRLSEEAFQLGDTVLYVMIPKTGESAKYDLVACKKSVLEKRDYKYIDSGTMIPVAQES